MSFGAPGLDRSLPKEASAPPSGIGEARRERPEPPGKPDDRFPVITLPPKKRDDEEEVTPARVQDDLLDLAFEDAWERYRKTIDPTMANPWGTRGSPLTRQDLDTLYRTCKDEAKKFPRLAESFKHEGGATEDGLGIKDVKEIPIQVRKDPAPGEKGHRRSDLALRIWKLLIHFNTTDTYKSGAIHKRELEAAHDIRKLAKKILYLVEKRFSGETDAEFEQRARRHCTQAMRYVDAKRKAAERAEKKKKDGVPDSEKAKVKPVLK